MKKILLILSALLFNVLVGGALAAASGLPPVAVIGAGSALSLLMPSMPGIMPMAVQKEIWLASIVEGLFADNTFMSKAFSADEFVNQGRTVHIPNAGIPRTVTINRNSFPATIEHRTDIDVDFDLDEFTTAPVRIPHADTVELSYNKRESVIGQDRRALFEAVANHFTWLWAPASTQHVKTTGGNASAHLPSATGNRKKVKVADIRLIMDKFNQDDVPQENRYLLLDAIMYGQLLDALTDKELVAFHSQADPANGVVGKLLSFNVMMRSKALRYDTSFAKKKWTDAGATTDNAGGLAWHIDSVARALGEIVMFGNESDPLFYGDIYSFLVRAGGTIMRDDKKGIIALVQDT
ncbi:MAG: hypothetical protein WC959_12215 [Kiritimatiellales bacterium]